MSKAAATTLPVTSAINPKHKDMANAIRALAMDAVEKAKSGHPGMPMGMADVATVLLSQFLRFDPENPIGRIVTALSCPPVTGRCCFTRSVYLTGYKKMTMEAIKNFRQLGSLTPGHPNMISTSALK